MFINDWFILFFYINDIIAMCFLKYLTRLFCFKAKLNKLFEIYSIEDINWFLGIWVLRDRPARKIWLIQDSYINKIIQKFNCVVDKSPKISIQMIDLLYYKLIVIPNQILIYVQKIKSVNYVVILIRLDISFACLKLSHYLKNPLL